MEFVPAFVVSLVLCLSGLAARRSRRLVEAIARHEFGFWKQVWRDPGYQRYGEDDSVEFTERFFAGCAILFACTTFLALLSILRELI
jgi:hypothetical protein